MFTSSSANTREGSCNATPSHLPYSHFCKGFTNQKALVYLLGNFSSLTAFTSTYIRGLFQFLCRTDAHR